MHDFDKSPDDDNDDDIELLIIVLKVVIHYLNLPTEIDNFIIFYWINSFTIFFMHFIHF